MLKYLPVQSRFPFHLFVSVVAGFFVSASSSILVTAANTVSNGQTGETDEKIESDPGDNKNKYYWLCG
jgi:hypothetical protein